MIVSSQIIVNIYTYKCNLLHFAGHKLIKCVCFSIDFLKILFGSLKAVLPNFFAKLATFFTKATQVDYLGKLGEVLER